MSGELPPWSAAGMVVELEVLYYATHRESRDSKGICRAAETRTGAYQCENTCAKMSISITELRGHDIIRPRT